MLDGDVISAPEVRVSFTEPVACLTCCGAVVGDVAGHVDGPAVNAQVSHAAHKVPVLHREVLWQVGNSPKQQWTCQIQGPEVENK